MRGLWTKWHKHQEARAAGYTKKRFKGLDQAPRYVSPTVTYVYGYDYSLKIEQRVSLLTLAGRIIVPYRGWTRHVTLLRETAEIGEAKLWYDTGQKRFYLLVALSIETPDPSPRFDRPGRPDQHSGQNETQTRQRGQQEPVPR